MRDENWQQREIYFRVPRECVKRTSVPLTRLNREIAV